MNDHLAVYRHHEGMETALSNVRQLRERYRSVYVQDKGKTWNTNLVFTLELGFMLDCAEAVSLAAIERKESRGAHTREDLPGTRRRELAEAHPSQANRRRTGPRRNARSHHPMGAAGTQLLAMPNPIHIQSAPSAPPPDRRACDVAKAVYDEIAPRVRHSLRIPRARRFPSRFGH